MISFFTMVRWPRSSATRLQPAERRDYEFIVPVLIVAVLIGWIWGTVLYDASRRDELAIAEVQRANANLAAVVAEHSNRTLSALDQIAKLAQARYEELGSKFDLDRFVKEVGFDGKLVLAMIITDEHGNVLAKSQAMAGVSLADRTYFQRHRAEKLGRSIISPPLFGRVVPRWVMPISWRLDKADGSFGGILSMGINPYYFTDVYRRIDIGKDSVITLVGNDGIVRARLSGDQVTFGQEVSASPSLAAARQHLRGSIIHDARIDGVRRLYSYDTLADYPLHVTVGSAMAAVLAVSREETREDYLFASGATVAILGAALLFGFFRRRQRSSDRALRESEQRFRVLVENMDDIFWIGTPALDAIHYLSPGFRRTLGVEPDLLYREPEHWQELLHPEDRELAHMFIAQQLRAEPAACEARLRRADGSYRWLYVRSVPWRNAYGALLVAGMAEDVTERKQASEQRLREAERQRDALVMEVHHRIKNNLQGVLGLLEEHRHANAETRDVLKLLATRIQSVATVHGLQGRRAGSAILLPELIQVIAENACALDEAHIETASSSGQEELHIKERESVPVALILNELIWNAIKHSTEKPPQIRVRVEGTLHGMATIEIRNRGALDEHADQHQRLTGGIGLGLIRALMPPQGAKLTLDEEQDSVVARLVLSAPVLDYQPMSAAA